MIRPPGDKNDAGEDQNLLLALVDATKTVGDQTPFRLGSLTFRHRLHRIGNDIALIHWVRPAHAFEAGRDAKLRKGLAPLSHRGAQRATRVHQLAHSRGRYMQYRGGERRPTFGGLSDDARIELPPKGKDRFARERRLAQGERLTDADVLVEHMFRLIPEGLRPMLEQEPAALRHGDHAVLIDDFVEKLDLAVAQSVL